MTYEAQHIAELVQKMCDTIDIGELNTLYRQADAVLWSLYTYKGNRIRYEQDVKIMRRENENI